MTSQSFDDQFRRSADILVQMFDPVQDRLLLASMSEADYREASFLDQRILTPERGRQWIGWDELAAISGGLPGDARFIFHIGHVGSTLISRLLGELPGQLALREPLLLRSFAELYRLRDRPEAPWPPEHFLPRLETALAWLARRFRPGQAVTVKASSFASDLAPPILQTGAKALFLYVAPQTYIATILAGENSVQELAVLGGGRLTRLHERLGEEPWRLWRLSPGERAAMAWACEMSALQQAGEGANPQAVLWLDFDDFLRAPGAALIRIASHFGITVGEQAAAALVSSPIMRRYSKAPEHDFSPALRAEILADARRDHDREIRKGHAWIEAAARDHALLGRAFDRAVKKD